MMAMIGPDNFVAVDPADFINPARQHEPLKTTLSNLGYLWKHHSPPLVSMAPTQGVSRATLHYPIHPSADGLEYTFQFRVVGDTDGMNLTMLVKSTTSYTGRTTTWDTTVINAVTTITTGNVLKLVEVSATIASTAVALEFSLTTATMGASLIVHHILVFPEPTTVPAGKQTSGAVLYDDSMFEGAGAAIHTELLNRCKTTPLMILKDRWQQCFSFCQDGPTNPQPDLPLTATSELLQVFTPMIFTSKPGQSRMVLRIYVIATVSSGTNTNRVQLLLQSNAQAWMGYLNADGTIKYADFVFDDLNSNDIYAKISICAPSAGTKTFLHAISGYWRPLE
jgi:hypothetical protein